MYSHTHVGRKRATPRMTHLPLMYIPPNSPSCITAPLPKVGQIFWARERGKTEDDEGKQKSDAKQCRQPPFRSGMCNLGEQEPAAASMG